MLRDYEADISVEKAKLAEQVSQMDALQQDFLSEAVDFLRAWYWIEAEAVVSHNPDVTRSLGAVRLAALKDGVRNLQARVEEVVSEFLRQDDLWWHREQGEQSYLFYGLRMPDDLRGAVNLAAGKLEPLLLDSGFLKRQAGYPASVDIYLEWDKSGRYHPPNARPTYDPGTWPQSMQEPVKKYDIVRREAELTVRKINALERERAENEAKGLWDQA